MKTQFEKNSELYQKLFDTNEISAKVFRILNNQNLVQLHESESKTFTKDELLTMKTDVAYTTSSLGLNHEQHLTRKSILDKVQTLIDSFIDEIDTSIECKLSEKKILKFDEKTYIDTLELLKDVKTHNVIKLNKMLGQSTNVNDNAQQALRTQYFDTDRTIWLELTIVNSLFSSMLLQWLYSTSKYDGTRLHIMGARLEQIMFQKPSDYSDDEKSAIQKLYDKAFGL